MLPPEFRLKKRYEFQRVKRLGSSLAAPFFVVSVCRRADLRGWSGPRFGFVVSSTVSRKAVERNRIRRRLREAVRLWLKEEQGKLGGKTIDIVFILRRQALKASYEELDHWLNRLLPKVFEL